MKTDILVDTYINNQLDLLNDIFLTLEGKHNYKVFSNVDKKELENYAKSNISLYSHTPMPKGQFFIGYTKQDLTNSIKTKLSLFVKGLYKLTDVLPLLNEMHVDYFEDEVMKGYFSICINPPPAKVRQLLIDQFLKEN